MGTILYNGPFKPQFHESELLPYENFTVKIPLYTAKGRRLMWHMLLSLGYVFKSHVSSC